MKELLKIIEIKKIFFEILFLLLKYTILNTLAILSIEIITFIVLVNDMIIFRVT